MLLLLGIVQVAVAEHAAHVLQAAASQALAATRIQGGSAAAGRASATSFLARLAGGSLDGERISVTRGPAQADVQLHAHVQPVIPGLSLTISAHADGPLEP
jgi:Flp pilus assembly protein TadG